MSYYKSLVDSKIFKDSVLPFIKEKGYGVKELSDLRNIVPMSEVKITKDPLEIEKALLDGSAAIYFKDKKENTHY